MIILLQPFLLEIELLQSKGESVLTELKSFSGVESRQRESSPTPPLLLCAQPPVPTRLKPLKGRFSPGDSAVHNVWITNVSVMLYVVCFYIVRDTMQSIVDLTVSKGPRTSSRIKFRVTIFHH